MYARSARRAYDPHVTVHRVITIRHGVVGTPNARFTRVSFRFYNVTRVRRREIHFVAIISLEGARVGTGRSCPVFVRACTPYTRARAYVLRERIGGKRARKTHGGGGGGPAPDSPLEGRCAEFLTAVVEAMIYFYSRGPNRRKTTGEHNNTGHA